MTMKKTLSMFFVLLVCFCFSSVAYADVAPCFKVNYYDEENYPHSIDSNETPQFEAVVPDENNPDSNIENITLGTPVTADHSEFTVPITLPTYTKTGEYEYSITQKPGSTAGVEYDEGPIVFRVLVRYNDAGNIAVIDTGAGFSGENKKASFTNIFHSGTLSVTNTVSGTDADRNIPFEITVAFTAPDGQNISEPISYIIKDANGTKIDEKTIGGSGNAKTVKINLRHGNTATFNNVPAGVNYTVTQATLGGFNAPVYESNSGSITAGQSASASVTNNAILSLNTGVLFQNTGALVILVIAVVGILLLLFRRKRKD